MEKKAIKIIFVFNFSSLYYSAKLSGITSQKYPEPSTISIIFLIGGTA